MTIQDAIKRDKTIEEIRNSCSTIFEIDCKNTNIKGILILLSKFENASYQIHFLFPKIKEEDARKLYLALYYFILQIVKSEVYDINDVEDNKKDFILKMESFKSNYEDVIITQLKLGDINDN